MSVSSYWIMSCISVFMLPTMGKMMRLFSMHNVFLLSDSSLQSIVSLDTNCYLLGGLSSGQGITHLT